MSSKNSTSLNNDLSKPVRSPVVFIIFNRPDKTLITFDAIAKARPTKLLVIADGPRTSVAGELELCEKTRKIIDSVDWDCEVLKNYSDINLGCRNRLATGLNWVFEQVPEAIILEDDCLPAPEFFQFCDEMLSYYRDEDRIGMISGDNFQNGIRRGTGDYYFSRYCHIWGWATWARAWKNYDVNVSRWPELRRSNWLESIGFSGDEKKFWTKAFDRVHSKQQDTWDYQWTFSCWLNNMLAIMPNVNLISNIGFDNDATHTTGSSIYSDMALGKLNLPLQHVSQIQCDQGADHLTSRNMFSNSKLKRALMRMKTLLGVRL